MPRTSTILRPDLGALAYEYSMNAAKQGFIGSLVLPPFYTPLKNAQYPVIPAEAILEVADTQRAARSAYARGDWEFVMENYSCSENGWEEPIDDTEAELFRSYFDAETVAVERATSIVLRSMERRVAKKVMDTKVFTNAAAKAAWNSYGTADPLADVSVGKATFRHTVGLQPNALIMDKDVFDHISLCEAVIERVKYTSPNAIRGALTVEQLKAYFGVEHLLVAGAVYNSSAKKQTKKIESVWPVDKVMLACISSGGNDLKEPSLGRTFVWENDAPDIIVTEQYREEQTRSDIYRVRQYTDECIQFAGAGYIITGVTA